MSVFLMLTFLPSMLPVNYVFASNNGPTAPEATSFEPVDATDMVNLSTGDLSYVMPLLNIPSPEGGYPLSLSYHAGIAMDQEASWVGLGWSLNPGAINRNVSGLPDDWKEGTKADVIYNIGGESKQKNFSASVGWGNAGSIGLYISSSSNRAFGGEGSYSSSTDFGVSGSLGGLGGRVGTNGVGINFDIVKAIAVQAVNADTGAASEVFLKGHNKTLFTVGIDANFKTGSVTGSISKNGIGISLGTNYGSLNIGQGSIGLYGNNALSTNLNLEITGFTLMIPFYNVASISYSERKTKYWVYDRLGYDGIGSLYADNLAFRNNNDDLWFANHFDSYESTYEHNKVNQLKTNNYAFISYDDYMVSGQGISGEMSPKILEAGALKNKYQKIEVNSEGNLKSGIEFYIPTSNFQKGLSKLNNNIHFYFENFYASYLESEIDSWDLVSNFGSLQDLKEYQPNNNFNSISPNGKSNYNAITKQAYKGNFVETYTNQELNSGFPLGFIESSSKGFFRNNHVGKKTNDGIGAFKITTIDGKTYHYSLPVYQKEKFSRSAGLEEDIYQEFYEEQSLDSYATHWLLTAVTGPDYIDLNDNHKVDNNDYGYWVNFEYGKWSDGYSWRNPAGNLDYNDSEKTKSYQWGIKEIYYLNKINTRTHSAFFIKEVRKDNYSTGIHIGQSRTNMKIFSHPILGYQTGNVLKGNDGYYLKGAYQNLKFGNYYSAINARANVDDYYYISTSSSHKTLKLNKILLYKNENIPNDIINQNVNETTGTLTADIFIKEELNWDFNDGNVTTEPTKIIKDVQYSGEFYQNVLDVNDVDFSSIKAQSSKIIDFGYSYELFDEVPNAVTGRLTLKHLGNNGKNGVSLIPPYYFDYQSATYSRNFDDWGYNTGTQAGSLKKIRTPTGADIDVIYEEDDYHQEIIPTRRVFDHKLQFNFSIVNNKLQIIVEDEQGSDKNINFNDFFETGKTDLDLWTCYVKDYFSGGCNTRSATIDIPKVEVDVISVDINSITLETNISYTEDNNGGLNELLNNSPFGLEHHTNMIRIDKLRNECESPDGCINVTPRLVMEYYLYGNKDIQDVNGGGIRVKSIKTSNVVGKVYSTNYYYNHPNFNKNKGDINYRSSGVTSYAPAKYIKEVKYINELPSPYVIYEYVTLEKTGNNKFNGKTQYQFKVLNNLIDNATEFSIGDMLKISKLQDDTSQITLDNVGETINGSYNKFVLEDNLASIGSLLKVNSFNEYGQLMKTTENNYKSNLEKEQGIIEESFTTTKMLNDDNDFTVNFTTSSKIKYPNVIESIKTSEGGIVKTGYNDVYDFNTGQVIETRSTNSRDEEVKSVSVPAYTRYSAMGSKVDNHTNKNMLSQQAMSKSYIKENGQWSIVGIGISTWQPSDTTNVWRKHKTYTWDGESNSEGLLTNYQDSNDDGFNWSDPEAVQPDDWKQLSETTLYNNYSMPLEIKDINGNKASTKMGDKDSKIYSTGNAAYDQMFYSGSEDLAVTTESGGVAKDMGYYDNSIFHTGKSSLRISSGQTAYTVAVKDTTERAYKVSLWAKKGTYTSTRVKVGTSNIPYNDAEIVIAGDWVQLNFYFTLNSDQTVSVTSNGSDVYVDDFRLHPVTSTITSYVYNEWDELTHIIGANNMATKYKYDSMGRLKETFTEAADFNGADSGGFIRISENNYTYKY